MIFAGNFFCSFYIWVDYNIILILYDILLTTYVFILKSALDTGYLKWPITWYCMTPYMTYLLRYLCCRTQHQWILLRTMRQYNTVHNLNLILKCNKCMWTTCKKLIVCYYFRLLFIFTCIIGIQCDVLISIIVYILYTHTQYHTNTCLLHEIKGKIHYNRYMYIWFWWSFVIL